MINVMIVDNESAIRKGMLHFIQWTSLGCEIAAQAGDGQAALDLIPAVKPDLIISDIRMPGMDGLELASRIYQEYPDIKVIILTGYPDFKYAQRAIQSHVVDFVLKPVSVENLTRAVEKAKAEIEKAKSRYTLQQELVHRSQDNLELQRTLFLNELIHHLNNSQIYAINRSAQLGMDLSNYYVLKLLIQPLSGESLTDEQYVSCMEQTRKIAEDCFSGYPLYFLGNGPQECFAVISATGEAPVTAICYEVENIVGSLPMFILSIGISNCFDNPASLDRAAVEATQAAQFASFNPDQSVMHFAELNAFPHKFTEEIYELLLRVKNAIAGNHSEEIIQSLDTIFEYCHQKNLTPETVRSLCVYIHHFVMDIHFPDPEEAQMVMEDTMTLFKRIIDTGDPDEMESCIRKIAVRFPEKTSDESKDTAHLILMTKSFIEAHYQEPLSLEQLASHFYISPSYLSRVFKRETGENISTFIQTIRIEQAKTLLKTTSLKSYEIADRVGIQDPVYFSRIFKKITGCKPKDYRNTQ